MSIITFPEQKTMTLGNLRRFLEICPEEWDDREVRVISGLDFNTVPVWHTCMEVVNNSTQYVEMENWEVARPCFLMVADVHHLVRRNPGD